MSTEITTMDKPTKLKKNGNGRQLAKLPEPSAPSLFSAIVTSIKSGEITSENVAAMEGAMKLFEKMQDREAERQFATQFVQLQDALKNVKAVHAVPGANGTVRYRVAEFHEIDEEVRPLANKYGFGYWFEEGQSSPDRVTKICHVQHVDGYKRSNAFTVRKGSKAPPGSMNPEADIDMGTHSRAKRGALCDAFSIVVEQSDDVKNLGKTITKDEAEDIQKRVKALAVDEARFLEWCQVAHKDQPDLEDYMNIPEALFDRALQFLEKKENQKRSETSEISEGEKRKTYMPE